MLFHVRMDVAVPYDLDAEVRAELVAHERARAEELQRAGTWVHLWRVVGKYSNISIFEVTPLTQHPSAIDQPPAGSGQ